MPLLGCVGIRWAEAGCAAGRRLLHVCLVQRAVQILNVEKHHQQFRYRSSSNKCRKKMSEKSFQEKKEQNLQEEGFPYSSNGFCLLLAVQPMLSPAEHFPRACA